MLLNFRQGIVKAEPNFLQVSVSGVTLKANNSIFLATLSDGENEYLIKQFQTINNAWIGSFISNVWLYIDINNITANKTFNFTYLSPIFSNIEPVSPAHDQHWFDTNVNKMKVYNSSINKWVNVIRIFVAKLDSGTIPNYIFPIGNSQAGVISKIRSGTILIDSSLKPIRKNNGTFFTTEDDISLEGFVQYIRLESNSLIVKANQTIPRYSIVKIVSDSTVELANYNDVGNKIIALMTQDTTFDNFNTVLLQGIVVNINWNWNVNDTLWVEANGELVNIDPNISSPLLYPNKKVPVGRAISKDTIIFEQGLGGVGPVGPPSAAVNPATDLTFGTVKLLSSTSSIQVVSDNDSRLIPGNTFSDINHSHQAINITSIPTGFISSTNLQNALTQISTDVVLKTGSTLSGNLNFNNNKITNLQTPTSSLDGANKSYVDSKVLGLNWKDPIHTPNLISDTSLNPPISPKHSDTYIVPSGGAINWGFPDGSIVHWNFYTNSWVNETDGNLSAHPIGTRFGISIGSDTIAGGTFLGKDNQIAVLTNSITPTWSFDLPTLNDAVYVNNIDSLHAYHQYVYNGNKWVEFGGGQEFVIGSGLVLNGNILNVAQSLIDISTLSPIKGNIIVGDGNNFISLGVGTNNQILTVDNTTVTGVKWNNNIDLTNMPNGTVINPSFSYAASQNTGIYSPGNNQIAITSNSIQRFLINGSNNTIELKPTSGNSFFKIKHTDNILSLDTRNSTDTNSTLLSINTSGGPVIIGHTDYYNTFSVLGDGITVWKKDSVSDGNCAYLDYYSHRGTFLSRTDNFINDDLFLINAFGYSGAEALAASLQFEVDMTPIGTAVPGRVVLTTTNISGIGQQAWRTDSLQNTIFGPGVADRRLHVEQNSTATNTVTNVCRFTSTSTGIPANGIGVGIEFEVETSSDNNEIGSVIETIATNVTPSLENFDLKFRTMSNGLLSISDMKYNSTGLALGMEGVTNRGKLQIHALQRHIVLGFGNDPAYVTTLHLTSIGVLKLQSHTNSFSTSQEHISFNMSTSTSQVSITIPGNGSTISLNQSLASQTGVLSVTSQNPGASGSVVSVLSIGCTVSSGTTIPGWGAGLEYNLVNNTGIAKRAGLIDAVWQNSTNTSEDSKISFKTMVAGSVATERAFIGQGIVVGTPIGNDKGIGSINTTGLFINGIPIPYDINSYIKGIPSSGSIIFLFLSIRNFSLSNVYNTPRCESLVAATSLSTFTIYKNGVSIGTIVFNGGSTIASVTISNTSFLVGDKLTIQAPSPSDATLSDISFILPGIIN